MFFSDEHLAVATSPQERGDGCLKVAAGATDLCFVTQPSIDDVGRHLASREIPILEGSEGKQDALGAMTSIYCCDPDGNLLEISGYLGE